MTPHHEVLDMTSASRLWRSAEQHIVGGIGMALLTFGCFRLRFDLAHAAFVYLILITVLSRWGTYIGSIILSTVAALCLAYFFALPSFSFRVESLRDTAVVAAFLITGLIVTGLVRSARERTEAALQAESALRRGEAYLTEAQRLSRTGSFGWRVSNGKIFWSEETFRIYEYDTGTRPTMELMLRRIHPDDAALVRSTIERAARDGEPMDFEHRLMLPDGSVKHARIVAHAERDRSGELEFVGAVTDITAAKQAEVALRASEQQWRAVFENNPTMYFMVDASGIILAVNPFGAGQLGYTIDEMVGRAVGSVFVAADRKAAQREIARCLDQLGQSIGWELRKQRKDGSVIWVRETARAVLRANDPVVLIACQDITEQKQAEENLREAQANLARVNRAMILGEMTASIAHEVNQPLTGVVAHAGSCLRWLAAEPPNLEEARQALEFIIRDGNRAEKVIDRIRALVKKMPPCRDRVDIKEAILETIALTRAELQKNGVELRTHLSSDLPFVPADRVQLQQVILNLIVNAIEAMSEVDDRPRELLLESGRGDSNDVFVAVRDTGRGLDPSNVSRLFDSFYTNKPGGIGMGLSISRSIVEAHGGRIWATPHEPHGAVFHFTLPVKEET